MVDVSRFIDTSDATPRVKWPLLASTLVGSLGLAHVYGLIDLVQTVGGGLWGSVDRLAAFVGPSGVTSDLLEIPVDALEAAMNSNQIFLEAFGPLGVLVAFVEVVAIVLLVLTVSRFLVRRTWRSI